MPLFKNRFAAERYRKKFRKDYGYKPTLFTIQGKRKTRFRILRPAGLVKIR